MGEVANRTSKAGSTAVSARSNASRPVTKTEFAKAMAHLCALKRTTDFSDAQIVTWFGGLAAFPAWVINRSILTMATSQERFPEFGDLYQLCRREAIQAGLMQEPYSPHGTGEKPTISRQEITSIGEALGLAVRP